MLELVLKWLTVGLIGLATVFLATNKRYRWFYIIIKTLPRDVWGLVYLVRLHLFVRRSTNGNATVPKLFADLVQKHPQKVAFYFEDEAWTYAKVDEFSNKIARYFTQKGFKKGDVVALFLENCVEYPCIWLGLLKIGVNTALINTNLFKESLLHSITVTECKSVIFGTNLTRPIQEIASHFSEITMYQFHERDNVDKGVVEGCVDLRKELNYVSGQTITESCLETKHSDPAIYIFTSGTTGLPKAAVITHFRCILLAKAYLVMGILSTNDIFYTPLPLYHTAGGLMGVGQALSAGITVALRKKFSATQYFLDCEKHNATVAQYVGEMCRYVLATPSNGHTKHKVRLMVGNGLRPQIWRQFVERFGIKSVLEVYGATEGISNLANIDNTEGAVGFLPRYCRFLYPMKLIKCDEATGEPIRNDKGRCIECGVEEPGVLIGKMDKNMNMFQFDGYTDRKSSEKKVISDVFYEGDHYFNSGDIFVYNELGYYFFKDRTGDTFRWKGENVSTSEVEAIISNIVQLNDVVVYGVKIPDSEGNAGMAAIVDPDKLVDINTMADTLKQNLPAYAVPIFIRVLDSVPVTGTFKLKKTELREEGYDVDKVKTNLYFLHPQQKNYVALTKDLHEDIVRGKIRL